MQGITTLPGAQQGNQQAPGQAAQFQAMPAKQGGIAPPITAPLEKLPPQQLLSMYNNPQDTTPKWAVATAYAKAVEQARLMQMAQGQSAMAQGQAQAQQPPVVQQVMSQPIPETQYAAHGGIMHGYAGGGAVAFDQGGLTKGYAPDYQAMRAAGIDISPYDSPEVRADKFRRFEEYKRSGVVPAASVISKELPAGAAEDREKLAKFASGIQKNALLPAGAAIADVATAIPRGLMGAYNSTVVRAMRAAGLPAAYLPDFAGGDFSSMTPFYDRLVRGPEQQEREEAKRKAEEAPPEASYSYEGRRKGSQEASSRATRPSSGLASLPGAAGGAASAATAGMKIPTGIPASVQNPELRKLIKEKTDAELSGAKPTEEEQRARQGLDALAAQVVKEKQDEEARRLSQAEKRMGEAEERRGQDPLKDIVYLGKMIEQMKGAKRFGDAIAGAASGAGKAQSDREEAFRKAEEKYDLSRNEIANLANLRQQAQIDQARVVEARASGDANRIRAAQEKASQSQIDLVKYEQGLGLEGRKLDLEALKIQAQNAATAAATAQGNQQRLMGMLSSAEAKKQELIRKITEDYKDSKKIVYSMASVPGAPKDAIEARAAADRELAVIIKAQTSEIDKILAQTAAQIPGFKDIYSTAKKFDINGNPL